MTRSVNAGPLGSSLVAIVDTSSGHVLLRVGHALPELQALASGRLDGLVVEDAAGRTLACDDLPHAAVRQQRPFSRKRLRLLGAGGTTEVHARVDQLAGRGLAVVTLEAEQEASLNRDFMAVVTHELRSPLASLHLDLERVRRKLKDRECVSGEEVAEEMTRTLRQVRRLMGLTQNVLDVTQMQRGLFSLDLDVHDLCAVVADAVDSLRPAAERAGCELSFEQCEPLVAYWDKLRIEQVVHNLVGNAIKYGSSGKRIEVTIERVHTHARVTVRDYGVGIAPADRSSIFEPFFRASTRDAQQSLGLGLYVVREIANAHGGRVQVAESERGGAALIMELPVREVARGGAG